MYSAEVMNGGHYQYFSNSTGVAWEEAVRGLKAIGLPELAENLIKSATHNDVTFSRDRDLRDKQLEEKDDSLEDQDTVFYDYDQDKIREHEMTYIKENKDKFYFKGILKVPESYLKREEIMNEMLAKRMNSEN